MKHARQEMLFALICAALLSSAGGCVGGRSFELAREAEKSGDASRAYDEYVKAGTRQQADSIGSDILRVSPAAADEAESAALAAQDAGDYQDAWRMFMRALEIQPNHPNTPQLIRRLEAQHPNEVAAAKADYLRRGPTSLAMIKPPPTQVASAAGTAGSRTLGAAPQASVPAPPSKASTPNASTPSTQQPAPRMDYGNTFAAASPPRTVMPVPTVRAEVQAPPARGEPTMSDDRPDDEQDDEVDLEGEQDEFGIHPLGVHRGARNFLMVHTLSKRDRHYPRSCRSIDGVAITLKDTDDDLEADFDLYFGNRRIKKIRDLELGRSQAFRGRSGELFRLTLLKVHNDSHTVRIGIKPA